MVKIFNPYFNRFDWFTGPLDRRAIAHTCSAPSIRYILSRAKNQCVKAG